MKTSKKMDILVYLLFAGVLVMFVFLFIVFFKTGHFELVQERLTLGQEVARITIVSDASLVEIRQGQEAAPYLLYDRQVANNTQDEIKVTQDKNSVTLTIQRQKSNRITNLGASSAKVALYLPKDFPVEVALQLDVLRLTVTEASFRSLSVDSRAFSMTGTGSQISTLALKGNVASVELRDVSCDSVSAKLNVGNLNVQGLDPEEGIDLKTHVNLGYFSSGLPIEFGAWGIVVNDTERRACTNAASRYDLDINLAKVILD